MKAKRKVIPAVALLLISLLTVSTASYAWISMNRYVSATGIAFEAKAPDNLLIRTDGTDWADTTIVTNVSGHKIYPASSSDGYTFYAIANEGNVINGDLGGIVDDSDISDLIFMPGADVTEVTSSADGWYAKYTLYLKTTGSGTVNAYLYGITVSDTDSASLDDCMRISIFTHPDTGSDTLVGIYDANVQDDVNPVASVSESATPGVYTATLNGSDPKQPTGDSDENIIAVTNGNIITLYVYVWIEGQNPNCKNILAADTFGISLVFRAR